VQETTKKTVEENPRGDGTTEVKMTEEETAKAVKDGKDQGEVKVEKVTKATEASPIPPPPGPAPVPVVPVPVV